MKIDLVTGMSRIADEVHVDRSVVTYIAAGRDVPHHGRCAPGISARGCLALMRVIKTWAVADGRGHVVPDDVASCTPGADHRLILDGEALFRGSRWTRSSTRSSTVSGCRRRGVRP